VSNAAVYNAVSADTNEEITHACFVAREWWT
jgi:hypothetical protein